MCPQSLNLDQKQKDRLKKWYDSIPVKPEDFDSVDCSSFITFTVYSTGLGDVIIAKALGQTLRLGYDDDGNFMD